MRSRVSSLTNMTTGFLTEYAGRSDDELLVLSSDRASLTDEAAAALDSELSRRNLTKSDQAKHQRFVKRNEHREAKRRRRRTFATRWDPDSWIEILWAVLAMALISIIYIALPSRYHLKPDWQEAAVNVMFASVPLAVCCSFGWRKIAFWISLLISSGIHLCLVHAWLRQAGEFSRGDGKLAVLLGFVLFFAVYGFFWLLRRKLYSEESGFTR